MVSNNQFDHVVINVGLNIDEAEKIFKNLGFSLTPRGRHTLGSINNLMIFGTNYLELLGMPDDNKTYREGISDAPVGINGVVFKTDDVGLAYDHLCALGIDGEPPGTFSRPVKIRNELRQASFKTVAVRPGIFSVGRVYFCQHLTPELVWRPEWQDHINNVEKILEFVTVSSRPDEDAAQFSILLNGQNKDNTILINGGKISILSLQQFQKRYENLEVDENIRCDIFGAIVLKLDSLGPLHNLIERSLNNLVYVKEPQRITLRINDFNTVLEFNS